MLPVACQRGWSLFAPQNGMPSAWPAMQAKTRVARIRDFTPFAPQCFAVRAIYTEDRSVCGTRRARSRRLPARL